MPSKTVDNVVKTMEDETDTTVGAKALKIKAKDGKKMKNKEEEVEMDIECPIPKKKKKSKLAEDHIDLNGNTDISEPPKKKNKNRVQEESKKKQKKTAIVEINEQSLPDTPEPTPIQTPSQSDDSTSESDKEPPEQTPEQKKGDFSNFRISDHTIRKLKGRGVSYLFDIQAQTFDSVYDGYDVLAQARTGTGKTFSFAIPLIEKLQLEESGEVKGHPPKVLVLAPTRELAIQVARDFSLIAQKMSVCCFYGGTPYNSQVRAIKNGIDILVGTPGRIKDHLENNNLDLSKLKHVVLDEVDRMLDMGFAEHVEEILAHSYKKDGDTNPQTLLFSATCPPWVYNVAKKYMKPNCKRVDLIGTKTQRTATTVEHLAIACSFFSQRPALIGDIIKLYSGCNGRVIIFCETKKEASGLALNEAIKQSCQALHGDIAQNQRETTLRGFRNGSFAVLVATDVAARGLDIPEVDLVIQCSPPKDVDSYIHRSGRTGRAGRTGMCICLYQKREEYQLRDVERIAGIKFKRVGPPSTTDLLNSSRKDALRLLDSVPATAAEYFRDSAEKLIEKKGAVDALAAALAHISGAASFGQRSLLNFTESYTTLQLTCSQEMPSMGYAWSSIKEQLGDEFNSIIQRMTCMKGKMGVCFDVPCNKVKEIQENWKDGRRWKLTFPTELPELEERPGGNRGGRDRFNGAGRQHGGRGFRRGGGGNFGGRGRGGQKRGFGQAFHLLTC
ncbi:nucleolar RNA helicase 2 [Stigmatopora argus]